MNKLVAQLNKTWFFYLSGPVPEFRKNGYFLIGVSYMEEYDEKKEADFDWSQRWAGHILRKAIAMSIMESDSFMLRSQSRFTGRVRVVRSPFAFSAMDNERAEHADELAGIYSECRMEAEA